MMKTRHHLRRLVARAEATPDRRSLSDPFFSLREAVKHMTLLEDHLAHPYKVCPDCIRKHLLTIEAFAEEAAALDTVGFCRDAAEGVAESARQWMEAFQDRGPVFELSQQVREVRKNLAPAVCDPRGSMGRVAFRYLDRIVCPHRG
jgi:hypothetical protein